jgi:hypothetical protein
MVVALVVLFVAGPSLAAAGFGGIAVVIAIEFVVALLGMRGATSSTARNTIVLVAGLGAGLIQLAGESSDFNALLAGGRMAIVVVLLYVHTYIMRDIVPEPRVTVSTIFGAVATYMLAILYWASVYSVLATLDADAFGGPIGQTFGVMDFLYYSAITQTTVGYGDIVPVSEFARSLASMEALTGQLYLAILVGWLVGRAVSQRPRAS